MNTCREGVHLRYWAKECSRHQRHDGELHRGDSEISGFYKETYASSQGNLKTLGVSGERTHGVTLLLSRGHISN